jgi:thiol-disulfide isomerase/thioredoxin
MVCIVMSGCICRPSGVSASATASAAAPTPDSVMAQFDDMLANGPVFIEFWSPECSWCTKQKPVLEELKSEYPGTYFIYVNTDEEGDLVKAFNVNGIPQMNVIALKYDNGSYLYISPSGKPTTDRQKSTILGYTELEKLKPVLDAAMEARK